MTTEAFSLGEEPVGKPAREQGEEGPVVLVRTVCARSKTEGSMMQGSVERLFWECDVVDLCFLAL